MATYISKQSGLWSSASTWLTAANGAVTPTADAGIAPQSMAGDRFIIRGGNIVEYDVIGEFGNDGSFWPSSDSNLISNAISLSGTNSTLKVSRTTSTSLSCRGSIGIGNGCVFDWGTTTDPLTAFGITSEIVLGTNSSTISTTLSSRNRCFIANPPFNGSNRITVTVCGKSKTRNTTLSGNHVTGSTTITAVDVTGWEVGDRIVIEPPRFDNSTYINMPMQLSAVRITNINGNQITLNTPLETNYSSGLAVGNFSSNITFKPARFIPGNLANPSPAAATQQRPVAAGFQLSLGSNLNSVIDIRNASFENLLGDNTLTRDDANAANPVGGFGAVFVNIGDGLVPVVLDNISFFSDKEYPGNQVSFLNKSAVSHFIRNLASVHLTTIGTTYLQTGVFSRFGPSFTIDDSNFYRHGYTFSFDQTNSDQVICKNVRVNNYISIYTGNFSINNFNGTNLTHRFTRGFMGLTFCTKFNLNNSIINGSNFIANRLIDFNNTGSWGGITFDNCNFSNVYLFDTPTSGQPQVASKETYINLYGLSGVPTSNRRYNSLYNLRSDYTNRYRGTASYSISSTSIYNSPYYVTETIEGFTGEPRRFVGYIKYDSNYGVVRLPYITFTDAGKTVNQTFSCSPSPNSWQRFDLTITPESNGPITMTLVGQTSSSNARVFLDGLSFFPITQKARHYGFEFEEVLPYRTVDSLTTLSEEQVSAVSTINNLDYFYDASNYWSVTNPSLTSYTDLYTRDGNILDFGTRNIVVDNSASTALTYTSATNIVTIKTPLLSSGVNFIGLRTTGNIYLSSGSTIGEIDIYGNVFQATPVSLSGVYMEGTLAYNTNSPITIEYTDCTMGTVQNDGSAIVTIKKTNSTIANGLDDEIADFVPTILNVTLNGGYIAIYDDTGTRQYYQNTDGAIVLPSSATGNWTYRIARYGYQYIQGSFTVDPNTGANITISPTYTPDTFVTSNAATVSTYTDLETTEKIYNYLNYWSTTSTGIDYTPFYSKAFGSITINKNVNLDATAASILTYNGSTLLTLKCSGLAEDVLFVSTGNVVAQNGTTYSDDVKIRATNLNSELILGGITSMTLYPTQNDRDDNTNEGDTLTGTIYRFLYNSVVSGVTLGGTIYARVDVAGTVLLYSDAITTGRNELEFGTTGTLRQIINNQKIINEGVQKASILVPHTTDI